MSYDPIIQWALIRTVCAIICAIAAVATFMGSYYYWTSWKKRSVELRKEIVNQIEREE